MKTVLSIVSAVAFTLSLDAQVSSSITARLERLADGTEQVWIRNNSAATLVTFVVTVKQSPVSSTASHAPLVMYSDPLIDPSNKPLAAGEERMIIEQRLIVRGQERNGKHFLEEPIMAAGILAGGSTTGDTSLLSHLALRRSNMLLAVETAMETLSDAGRHNVPRDRLIEQFKKMADFLNRWYLPPEQQVGLLVYRPLIGKLTNLTEGPIGSAFPPDAFVAQETAILRQRRMELLESNPPLADAFRVGTH